MFTNNSPWCPIKAYRKGYKLGRRLDQVAMGKEDGGNLTPENFNEILKELTTKSDKEGYYSSHSFRAGMPTLMANMSYSDAEIKRQ